MNDTARDHVTPGVRLSSGPSLDRWWHRLRSLFTPPEDEAWCLALSVPVYVAGPPRGGRPADGGVSGEQHPMEAVVVAERHATGWFVHAVRREGSPADALLVRQVITARVHELLTRGPDGPGWTPVEGAGCWVATCAAESIGSR